MRVTHAGPTVNSMTFERPDDTHPGPILLCAGTDPAAAARLAEGAITILAARAVVVLATWDPPPMSAVEMAMDVLYDAHADLRFSARNAAAGTAHAAAELLEAHGLHVTRTVCPQERTPWQEILHLADEIDASVIVAGASESTAPRAGSLGAQTRALAHRTRRPLLVLPADRVPAGPDAPALLACDGSPSANRAIAAAVALLRPRPAVVASVWHSVASVVGVATLAIPDDVARKGAAKLDEGSRVRAAGEASEGAAALTAAGWACDHVALEATRNVPTAIIDAADERDAAIVVTGMRGRSPIAAAVLGSNAENILRHAGRPVLLVPPADA